MKTKILLFCMVLGMFFISTTAYSETSIGSNSRSIPLEGEVERPGQMRSDIISMTADRTLITAEQQGNMILAHFHTDVGVVQVTITDSRGDSVFTETVDTDMQPMLTISLMGVPSGNYVITFSGKNVNLRGEFEIR